MKSPVQFGKFSALCPTAAFLGLPIKKVRRLRDLGLIRLPGGRTRPEDLAEDWMKHADTLAALEAPASPAHRNIFELSAPGRIRPSRHATTPPPTVAASYARWAEAQGGGLHTHSEKRSRTCTDLND